MFDFWKNIMQEHFSRSTRILKKMFAFFKNMNSSEGSEKYEFKSNFRHKIVLKISLRL